MSSSFLALWMNAASCLRALTGLTMNVSRPAVYGLRSLSASKRFTRFLDELRLPGHDAEGTAMVDVQMREVEREHVEHAAVDDHQLVVIAREVVGRP